MPKNHRFLVEIAAEIVKREPNARFLFVGDGPLRSEVEMELRVAGIRDRVILTGSRPDVPRLLLGAMDAFLFPSRSEGLGLALVEAQAAGLPATVSDSVPIEADVVPDLINRQSLRQPAAVWAEIAVRHRQRSTPGALGIVEGSLFNVVTSAKELSRIYSGK
jgi:glycosyltransferase involved in cell wall biosynthesis